MLTCMLLFFLFDKVIVNKFDVLDRLFSTSAIYFQVLVTLTPHMVTCIDVWCYSLEKGQVYSCFSIPNGSPLETIAILVSV